MLLYCTDTLNIIGILYLVKTGWVKNFSNKTYVRQWIYYLLFMIYD